METVESYPVAASSLAKFKRDNEVLTMKVKYAFTETLDKKLDVVLVGSRVLEDGSTFNENIKLIYPIYSPIGEYVVKDLKNLPTVVEETLSHAGVFLPEPDGTYSWFEKED